DAFNGGSPVALDPATLTGTPAAPFTSHTYTYDRSITVPAWGCTTYPNTAAITETGQSASAQVRACGPAHTGALTMGFWQNKNGQSLIKTASGSGVCSLTATLRAYVPFADLSPTATCTQVASYVNNVIKVANASGASMNAMLKAQMLATTLDVWHTPLRGARPMSAARPGTPT
ncbi:MAG: hypothetical protein ACKOA9_14200, partial [Actinomycetota bacterium]